MRSRDSSLPMGVKITIPYSDKENFYMDPKKLIIKIWVLRIHLGLLLAL